MTAAAVTAGLSIAVVSAILAEIWWRVIQPRHVAQATLCWMLGILTRVFVAIAGLAICIGLLHLAAPPLVVAMLAGYAIALTFETRLTIKRVSRLRG